MNVQDSGGLPEYICRIARALSREGRPISQAIAIAVSRVKRWAAGDDDVDADTRAKAAKAVAEWEALKAKSKVKKGAKKATGAARGNGRDNDKADLSGPAVDYTDMLCLARTDFNVDAVRAAFERHWREIRSAWRTANPGANYEDGPPYMYVREMWTSHLIARCDEYKGEKLYKIGYTVDAKSNVTFADPVEVRTQYVAVAPTDAPDADLSNTDIFTLLAADQPGTHLAQVIRNAGPDTATDLGTVLRRAAKTGA